MTLKEPAIDPDYVVSSWELGENQFNQEFPEFASDSELKGWIAELSKLIDALDAEDARHANAESVLMERHELLSTAVQERMNGDMR